MAFCGQKAMTDYNAAENVSSVTGDCTGIPKRAARALTDKMTVLPETGRAENAEDLFLVVSESGSEYLVDLREGACECADFQYREPENGCKHIYRIEYATGQKALPAWIEFEAVDPQLGEQTEALSPQPVTDGGGDLLEVEQEDTDDSADPFGNDQSYSYHYETPAQGGERYVRCTECGAECIPPNPDVMTHCKGCSEGAR